MRIFFFLFMAVLLITCGPSGQKADEQNNAANSEVHGNAPATTGVFSGAPLILEGCYEMTMKQDSAFLSLHVQDTIITGDLRYDWHERDGNVGTIKGVLRDSLIIADYTFQSEGLTSVREVVFKIIDTTLLQGFGELKERDGKVVYKNAAQLQYMNSSPFVKVPCTKND